MRKIILYTLMAAALIYYLFGVVSLALAYTYDGKISPKVIETWEIVDVIPVPPDVVIISKNPDQTHSVKYVIFVIDSTVMGVIGYSYYSNNELFSFRFHPPANRYRQIKVNSGLQEAVDELLKPHLKPEPDKTSFTKPI